MNYPLVSAVIITHNRKDFVIKAIASVLAQTYPNIELFVVDDASEDGTKETLESFSARDGFNYIYIPKAESKGGNHARNIGITRCNGDFVAFLDDDDEWFPEKTEKQVEYLLSHEECGVVACFNIVEFNYKDRFDEDRSGMIVGDVHDKIFTCVPFVTSVAMYRRKVLLDVGLFDENLRYWQETELNYRVAQVCEFGCVYDELALHRVVDNDKQRLTNHLEGWLKAIEYIEEKHNVLIKALPHKFYAKHKALIANDGLMRARKVNSSKYRIRFAVKAFWYQPSFTGLKQCIKAVIWCKC